MLMVLAAALCSCQSENMCITMVIDLLATLVEFVATGCFNPHCWSMVNLMDILIDSIVSNMLREVLNTKLYEIHIYNAFHLVLMVIVLLASLI